MRGRRLLGLGLALSGLAAVGLVFLRSRSPAGQGASLLLVTIDTLRADHVGAYGSRLARTPHLDALARRGLLFEEALASAPLTLPSHATILSGREPPHHGVRHNGASVFPPDLETLATVLAKRGYASGAFVGAYVLDRRFGLARGFAHYDDRIERRRDGGSVLESERRGEAVVAAAAQWIGGQGGRFFAWIHLYDPHAPYDPPSPFREQNAQHPYDGEAAYADACVGQILEAVALRGRVLVAVVGDHGEGLGEHGERGHGLFVYQSTLRVPMLLAGPGIPAGERRGGLARTVDLLPTLLGRLGVPPPAGLDGVDLLAGPPPREAYAETLYPQGFGWAPLVSWRRGPLKYIEAPRPELYDLAADPGETADVRARHRPEVEPFRQALFALRRTERRASRARGDGEADERLRALGYVGGADPHEVGPSARDPKDATALFNVFEEALAAEARGQGDLALRRLQELVAQAPESSTFRRTLAAMLRRAGRVGEAVTLLDQADSRDPLLWHERALALAQAGSVGDAVISDAKAVALDPDLAEAHSHLGVLEAGRGRLVEALRAFDAALAADPTDVRTWNNRANALQSLGRVREATEAYRKAMSLSPRDPDSRNGLGVLATEAEDLDIAADLFRQVLEIDPGYAEAYLNMAVVEVKRGRPEAARAHLRALLRRDPASASAGRARAFLRDIGAQ